MLGSMNPLVQRARNGNWMVTSASYIIASTIAGTAIGTALGALGDLTHPTSRAFQTGALMALALFGVGGALVDQGVLGARIPSVARQVDESWRYRYRNWVYAAGYGLQIGTGFATIVTTVAVYSALIAAYLSGSWRDGLLIGAVFGFVRAISVLAVFRVQTSEDFERFGYAVSRMQKPSKVASSLLQATIGGSIFCSTVLLL